ncbi:CD225/dispanin family protein [Lysobacter sp. CA199]|uniref:CD225/dispanin family protein n=1 Tax=Lysobacter sp. CA199 TaxID=3455608 RepID=UPI003F8D4425
MNQPVRAASPYPNYLPWSITLTVLGLCLCCGIGAVPGIVAIVFGGQADSKWAAGDEDGARRASETAKVWCWVGAALVGLSLIGNLASVFIDASTLIPEAVVDQLRDALRR